MLISSGYTPIFHLARLIWWKRYIQNLPKAFAILYIRSNGVEIFIFSRFFSLRTGFYSSIWPKWSKKPLSDRNKAVVFIWNQLVTYRHRCSFLRTRLEPSPNPWSRKFRLAWILTLIFLALLVSGEKKIKWKNYSWRSHKGWISALSWKSAA